MSKDNIFEAPTAQIFEDVDGEDKKIKEVDRVAELEAALKELRDKQEDEKADAALYTTPQWQSQVTDKGFQEVDPNTIQLPDPALDPDGYADAVARRTELRLENKARKENSDRQRNDDIKAKTDDLWADFDAQYGEYSEDRDRIDYIATKVVNAAVKKGIDVQRYMFGVGRPRFMKDVVKQYDKIFGAPEPDEEDNQPRRSVKDRDVSRRNARSRRDNSDNDDGRSAGVFGGGEGSGKPNRGNLDVETGPSMIDDIHAIQKKSGFW